MTEKDSKLGFLFDLFYPFSSKVFKDVTCDHGIFGALLLYWAYVILILLSLPVLPFILFNLWSKTWFDSKEEVSSDV